MYYWIPIGIIIIIYYSYIIKGYIPSINICGSSLYVLSQPGTTPNYTEMTIAISIVYFFL
jgi:hypothetical protein